MDGNRSADGRPFTLLRPQESWRWIRIAFKSIKMEMSRYITSYNFSETKGYVFRCCIIIPRYLSGGKTVRKRVKKKKSISYFKNQLFICYHE